MIVHFIDLRSIDSVEILIEEILQCFDKTKELDPIQQLCKFFTFLNRDVLLIFDNTDDLLAVDCSKDHFLSVTEQILLKCTKVKILSTSRIKFVLPRVNCKEYILPPLDIESASSFLISNSSNLSIDDARSLAISCGCAPLALWIIANLIEDSGVSPEQLIKEINPSARKPDINVYNLESTSSNSQLEACINSSYSRLNPNLKHTFCCLSVFPATFDLQAACSVVGATKTDKMLTSLKLRSLVSYDVTSKRYSIHPYLRFFAKTQRVLELSRKSTVLNFGTYFASLLQNLAKRYYSTDFKIAIKEIHLEKSNIIEMFKSMTEENELYEVYKQLADKFVIGFIHAFLPEKEYVSFYQKLLEKAEEREDTKSCSLVYFCLGYYRMVPPVRAIFMLRNAVSQYGNENWDDMHLYMCYSWMADICSSSFCVKDKAEEYVQKVEDFIVSENSINTSSLLTAFLLSKTSWALFKLHRFEKSIDFSTRALRIWDEVLGNHLEKGRELHILASSLLMMRMLNESFECSLQASEIYSDVIGNHAETAASLDLCGLISLIQGKYRKASVFMKRAVDTEEAIGSIPERISMLKAYRTLADDRLHWFERLFSMLIIPLLLVFPRKINTVIRIGTFLFCLIEFRCSYSFFFLLTLISTFVYSRFLIGYVCSDVYSSRDEIECFVNDILNYSHRWEVLLGLFLVFYGLSLWKPEKFGNRLDSSIRWYGRSVAELSRGDNSHTLMCHFFTLLSLLKNKFLGLFYSF